MAASSTPDRRPHSSSRLPGVALPPKLNMTSPLQIEFANEQTLLAVNELRLGGVAKLILRDAGVRGGTLSIAVVNDPAIHQINRDFLKHDYPTDVLSFALEEDFDAFEGEVLVSAETALSHATDYGWSAEDELLLYVIHGTLHLAGYRDKTENEQAEMRAAEARYLRLAHASPNLIADGNVGPLKVNLAARAKSRIAAQHTLLGGS